MIVFNCETNISSGRSSQTLCGEIGHYWIDEYPGTLVWWTDRRDMTLDVNISIKPLTNKTKLYSLLSPIIKGPFAHPSHNLLCMYMYFLSD